MGEIMIKIIAAAVCIGIGIFILYNSFDADD